MPDLVTLVGRFKLFETSKPINSQMRFEITADGSLYRCSVTPETKKFIAPGKVDTCRVLCAVSSREKFIEALRIDNAALITHAGHEVGVLSEFRIEE